MYIHVHGSGQPYTRPVSCKPCVMQALCHASPVLHALCHASPVSCKPCVMQALCCTPCVMQALCHASPVSCKPCVARPVSCKPCVMLAWAVPAPCSDCPRRLHFSLTPALTQNKKCKHVSQSCTGIGSGVPTSGTHEV